MITGIIGTLSILHACAQPVAARHAINVLHAGLLAFLPSPAVKGKRLEALKKIAHSFESVISCSVFFKAFLFSHYSLISENNSNSLRAGLINVDCMESLQDLGQVKFQDCWCDQGLSI